MEEEENEMATLRDRRKKSSIRISSCFGGGITNHRRAASLDVSSYSPSSPNIRNPSPRPSPSAWHSPESKGKSRGFISRISRYRRHSSADFSYDPLSYAMNFDEIAESNNSEDDFRSMNFASRLPASPPRMKFKTEPSTDHHVARTPSSRSPLSGKRDGSGSYDLRRGFEALSVSMNSNGLKETPAELPSPKSAAVAAVKKSLEPRCRGCLVPCCGHHVCESWNSS